MELKIDFRFNASLALPDYDGVCRTPHGYDFVMRLVLRALNVDMEKPWIADIASVEAVAETEVLSSVRDAYLNDLIAFPSLEGVALWIAGRLFGKMETLYAIEVRAGDRYSVTIGRDEWVRKCTT